MDGALERDSGGEPVEVAIDHAVRRWEAESVNAERLAHRENGALTLIAAVLGFGLFNVGALDEIRPPWLLTLLRILLAVALVLLGLALWKVLLVPTSTEPVEPDRPGGQPTSRRQRRVEVYASGHLRWPNDPEQHPAALASARQARLIAYARMTRAANSLHYRNLSRKTSLERGQRYLVGSGLIVALAVLCYILAGRPIATAPAPARSPAAGPAEVPSH